ncbi:MAG: ParA family protein [bacterium]
MVRVISIVNQKGGVGKTTTAVNLAAGFSHLSKKTLLIDVDSQGNATSGLGIAKKELEKTIYDSLVDGMLLEEVLVPSVMENLLVAPSNSDLLSAEMFLGENEQGKTRLKTILADYLWKTEPEKRPDYIVIDCPPSLGQLTLNALLASDSVLIPVQCEYYALEGLTEILTSTTMLRQRFNPYLSLEGILLTMADRRLNLSRQVEDDIRGAYGNYVFDNVVQRNVRLSEAPSHGLPIIMYDPTSKGAESYVGLAKEIFENEEKSPRTWPLRPVV